ncbi:MAG: CBS domain-containing protein [Candidatus Nanoarchaeia archaeon]|nr:CBS domain-containing protein [Candidatus Nanoarchaeia archaeon]MDD5740838.1 CBS domain-containing protein [Candidatus Nanoarchaeia archaeon]
MLVKEIMNEVCVVTSDITLKKAAALMLKHNIGSLVVLKENKLSGIVTERDVIKNLGNLDKSIFKIMTPKVITISQNASLEAAAGIMKKYKIKRVVVTGKKRDIPSGIITVTDIIANSDLLNEDGILI